MNVYKQYYARMLYNYFNIFLFSNYSLYKFADVYVYYYLLIGSKKPNCYQMINMHFIILKNYVYDNSVRLLV